MDSYKTNQTKTKNALEGGKTKNAKEVIPIRFSKKHTKRNAKELSMPRYGPQTRLMYWRSMDENKEFDFEASVARINELEALVHKEADTELKLKIMVSKAVYYHGMPFDSFVSAYYLQYERLKKVLTPPDWYVCGSLDNAIYNLTGDSTPAEFYNYLKHGIAARLSRDEAIVSETTWLDRMNTYIKSGKWACGENMSHYARPGEEMPLLREFTDIPARTWVNYCRKMNYNTKHGSWHMYHYHLGMDTQLMGVEATAIWYFKRLLETICMNPKDPMSLETTIRDMFVLRCLAPVETHDTKGVPDYKIVWEPEFARTDMNLVLTMHKHTVTRNGLVEKLMHFRTAWAEDNLTEAMTQYHLFALSLCKIMRFKTIVADRVLLLPLKELVPVEINLQPLIRADPGAWLKCVAKTYYPPLDVAMELCGSESEDAAEEFWRPIFDTFGTDKVVDVPTMTGEDDNPGLINKVAGGIKNLMTPTVVSDTQKAAKDVSSFVGSVNQQLPEIKTFLGLMNEKLQGDAIAESLQGPIKSMIMENISLLIPDLRMIDGNDIKPGDIITLFALYVIHSTSKSYAIKSMCVLYFLQKIGLLELIRTNLSSIYSWLLKSDDDEEKTEVTGLDIMGFLNEGTKYLLKHVKVVGAVVAALVFFLCRKALTPTEAKEKGLKVIGAMKNVGTVGSGIRGLGNIVGLVKGVLECVTEYVDNDNTVAQEAYSADNLIAISNSSLVLENNAVLWSVVSEPAGRAKVYDMYKVSLAARRYHMSRAQTDPASSKVLRELDNTIKRLMNVMNTMHSMIAANEPHKPPYHIMFCGEAGIGKSTMIDAVDKYIAAKLGTKNHATYARSHCTKHWDGFNASHTGLILDECFTTADLDKVDEYLALFSCVNFLPPMAALEDKGITTNNVRQVVSSTNIPYPQLPGVQKHSAIYRRRNLLVEAICDKDVYNTKNGEVDNEKRKAKYGDNKFGHLTFRILNRNEDNRAENLPVLDYETFLRKLDDSVECYMKLPSPAQTSLLSEIKEMEECLADELLDKIVSIKYTQADKPEYINDELVASFLTTNDAAEWLKSGKKDRKPLKVVKSSFTVRKPNAVVHGDDVYLPVDCRWDLFTFPSIEVDKKCVTRSFKVPCEDHKSFVVIDLPKVFVENFVKIQMDGDVAIAVKLSGNIEMKKKYKPTHEKYLKKAMKNYWLQEGVIVWASLNPSYKDAIINQVYGSNERKKTIEKVEKKLTKHNGIVNDIFSAIGRGIKWIWHKLCEWKVVLLSLLGAGALVLLAKTLGSMVGMTSGEDGSRFNAFARPLAVSMTSEEAMCGGDIDMQDLPKLESNTLKIAVGCVTGQVGHAYGVCGNMIVMNTHLLVNCGYATPNEQGGYDLRDSFKVRYIRLKGPRDPEGALMEFNGVVHRDEVKILKNSDITFVCSKIFPVFKDLRAKFMTIKERASLFPTQAICMSPQSTSQFNTEYVRYHLSVQNVMSRHDFKHAANVSTSADVMMTLVGRTQSGVSGSPVFLPELNPSRIVGLICGHGANTFAMWITQEQIEIGVDAFVGRQKLFLHAGPMVEPIGEDMCSIALTPVESVGVVDKAYVAWQSGKTVIRPTKLKKELKNKFEPAVLHLKNNTEIERFGNGKPHVPPRPYPHDLSLHFSAFAEKQQKYDAPMMEETKREVIREMERHLKRNLRVLTLDEAILGSPPLVPPLRRDTSPGLPYVLNQNGIGGKKKWINLTGDILYVDDNLRNEVAMWQEQLSQRCFSPVHSLRFSKR
ncbi:MAG: RNA helicase [Sanya polycipivirus 1]|nr:MAG: RNA helicase [Sanya polycipivirus 1]